MTVEELKAEIKKLRDKELQEKKLREQAQPPISVPPERNDWDDLIPYSSTDYDIGKPTIYEYGRSQPIKPPEIRSFFGPTETDDADDEEVFECCICVKELNAVSLDLNSFTVGDMYEIIDEDGDNVVVQNNKHRDVIIENGIFNEYFVRKIVDLNE